MIQICIYIALRCAAVGSVAVTTAAGGVSSLQAATAAGMSL